MCLGDSITAGAGVVRPEKLAWPAQLEARLNAWSLDPVADVSAHGVGGATLLAEGDRPYRKTDAFRDAMAAPFDHVVVMLGTNDTVEEGRGNWRHNEAFEMDLQDLCARVRERGPDATIWIVGPPPMFPGAPRLDDQRVASLTARQPRLRELVARASVFAAARDGVEHVPLEGVLTARRTLDGVHPDPFGHEDIARALHGRLAPALGVEVTPLRTTQPAPSAEYRSGAGWNGTWWDAFSSLQALPLGMERSPEIVFLGDSITQGLTGHPSRGFELAGMRAVSLGLSGDRTEHLRYRIRHGALRRWIPERIVLQIGINNLNAAGHSPEETAKGIRAVVNDLRERHPWTRILVCGPFPAGRSADAPLRLAVDEVHRRIEDIGEGSEAGSLWGRRQVHYLDLRGLFLNEDGTPNESMAGDALHISGKGKERWRKAIVSWVEQEGRGPMVPRLPKSIAWVETVAPGTKRETRRILTLEKGGQAPREVARGLLLPRFGRPVNFDMKPLAKGVWAFNGPLAELDEIDSSRAGVRPRLTFAGPGGLVWTSDVDAMSFDVEDEGERVIALTTGGSVVLLDPRGRLVETLVGDPSRAGVVPRAVRFGDGVSPQFLDSPEASGRGERRWLCADGSGGFEAAPPEARRPPVVAVPGGMEIVVEGRWTLSSDRREDPRGLIYLLERRQGRHAEVHSIAVGRYVRWGR